MKEWIIKHSPGYENTLDEEKTKTSKILYARRRVSFTRLLSPGIHIEAEDYIMDKRLKVGMFRHFGYFGPRGEILLYFFTACFATRIMLLNLRRETNIESLLNDRNVFLKLELPVEERKIK